MDTDASKIRTSTWLMGSITPVPNPDSRSRRQIVSSLSSSTCKVPVAVSTATRSGPGTGSPRPRPTVHATGRSSNVISSPTRGDKSREASTVAACGGRGDNDANKDRAE